MSAQLPLPLPFLRTEEAARFVGLSWRTLEKHRVYGRDGEKGCMFVATGERTDAMAFVRRAHHFRFIVTPEE